MDTFLQTAGADTIFYSERDTTAKNENGYFFFSPEEEKTKFFFAILVKLFSFTYSRLHFNVQMMPECIQYLCIIPGLTASLLKIINSKRCA